MINEMANIASECVKNPTRPSILVPELGSYICPDSRQGQRVLAETKGSPNPASALPPPLRIDPQFKLVFLTAAVGSLFSSHLCRSSFVY